MWYVWWPVDCSASPREGPRRVGVHLSQESCVSVKAELDGLATDAEMAEVRDQLADLRQQHDQLAAAVASRQLSPMLAAKSEPQILADIEKAEKRERELLTPSVLAELMSPGKDVLRRWKDAAIPTKREAARMLFSADVLGELRVLRSPTPGHRCPVERRVQWWKP